MARRPGHKRGCRCVGCSPATRKKGQKALKKWAKNPRRKKRAMPAYGVRGASRRNPAKYRAGGGMRTAGWYFEIAPYYDNVYGATWVVEVVTGRKRQGLGTYASLAQACDAILENQGA